MWSISHRGVENDYGGNIGYSSASFDEKHEHTQEMSEEETDVDNIQPLSNIPLNR